MCGIAGQINFAGKCDEALVKKMTESLIHRGPDDEGFFVDGGVGLGMRRLNIIDLKTGRQPMHNSHKNVWVVFNGEIYNFRELRAMLEARGYIFTTQSDTEVIVHLYDEFGERFIEHLRGMFAIALWDGVRKRLVLARDRVGEKPLYYFTDGKQFLFASELKALLQSKDVSRELSLTALHHYMVYGRVPTPLCIVRGVQKLPPAHLLIVENGVPHLERYWSLSFKNKLTLSEGDLREQLLSRFESSVQSMMVADVPLGAFLSGGVDSSAIVAMMAKHSATPVETFSIGFRDEDLSELPYARMVAERFSTRHHEFVIEPHVLDVLPMLAYHLDEPFADASIIPAYYIASETKKFVTVALTGDGSDELFAGYEWFKALKLASWYRRLPVTIRKGIYYLSRAIPDIDTREGILRYAHKIRRFAETQLGTPGDDLGAFLAMTSGFTNDVLQQELYTPLMIHAAGQIDVLRFRREEIARYDGDDPLEAVLYSQFQSLLPDMFFTKVDRTSMAASLETRAPFVDYLLVEFAAQIPFAYKLRGFETKYILKAALRGLLPDSILDRSKKGFTVPLHRWMRDPKFFGILRAVLTDESLNRLGLFRQETIVSLVHRFERGDMNVASKLWSLYMFALWHEMFKKNYV